MLILIYPFFCIQFYRYFYSSCFKIYYVCRNADVLTAVVGLRTCRRCRWWCSGICAGCCWSGELRTRAASAGDGLDQPAAFSCRLRCYAGAADRQVCRHRRTAYFVRTLGRPNELTRSCCAASWWTVSEIIYIFVSFCLSVEFWRILWHGIRGHSSYSV